MFNEGNIINGKPADLRPASCFSSRQFPRLRRMADAELSASINRRYFLTQAAAVLIEQHPEFFLHFRLFTDDQSQRSAAYRIDKRVCEFHAEEESIEAGISERIEITAGRIPAVQSNQTVPGNLQFKHPLLPFDLSFAQGEIERRIATQGIVGYKSSEFAEAIYRGISPFHAYSIFSNLPEECHGIRHLVELGSGLSITGIIASLLLPNIEKVSCLEIDPTLQASSMFLLASLKRQLDYDTSRVSVYRHDAFDWNGLLGQEVDALAGFFPIINSSSHDERMLAAFRALRPGGYIFQLYTDCPIPIGLGPLSRDFREVEFRRNTFIPVRIFQRL